MEAELGAWPGADPHSIGEHGITLTVRVTPKAFRSKSGGCGVLPDEWRAMAVGVAAPPVNGSADAALLTDLTKQLAVRGGEFAIVWGDAFCLTFVRSDGDGRQIT